MADPTPYPDPKTVDIGHMLLSNDPMKVTRTAFGWTLWHQHDTGVGEALRLTGEYALQEIINIQKFIKPGDMVLDVGAYIGTHTLSFARHVAPSGTVIALEAVRAHHQALQANLMMNGVAGVHTLNAIVGESLNSHILPSFTQDRAFDRGDINITRLTQTTNAAAKTHTADRVDVVTLDHLKLPKCDFIKINAPGSHAAILRGAHNILSEYRPGLHLTLHRHDSTAKIVALLKAASYDLYRHDTSLFRRQNVAKVRENPFRTPTRSAIFAFPAERQFDVQGFPPFEG